MASCVNKDKNEEKCPCTYTDCERHGICCECLRNHLANKSLPACVAAAAKKA